MNLACQKWLGEITKVLGFGATPPPHIGKNSQKMLFFWQAPLGKTSFKGSTEIVRGLTPLPRGLNRRDFSEKLVQQSYRKWGVPPAPFNVRCQKWKKNCRKGRCLPKKTPVWGQVINGNEGYSLPALKGRWDPEEQGSLLFSKMDFFFYKSSY